VSTATAVPQTFELEGDDALATLRDTGVRHLMRDAAARFRAADGFSHARALAFQITLTALPALIAAVGLATATGQETFRRVLQETMIGLSPGPTGDLLTQAFEQASTTASSGSGRLALAGGFVAALLSATVAMTQVERGANRIYGVEQDRPAVSKYWHGFMLACSAGFLIFGAFVLFVAGREIGGALGAVSPDGALATVWLIGRWPVGIALVVLAFSMLFKESPRRRQPSPSWLAVGSLLAVAMWLVLTALLGLYLALSRQFGDAYGPLAGVIGGLLWALLTSLALYLGLAFSAQLEAVRAGKPGPRTGEQENPSEPVGRGSRDSL